MYKTQWISNIVLQYVELFGENSVLTKGFEKTLAKYVFKQCSCKYPKN